MKRYKVLQADGVSFRVSPFVLRDFSLWPLLQRAFSSSSS